MTAFDAGSDEYVINMTLPLRMLTTSGAASDNKNRQNTQISVWGDDIDGLEQDWSNSSDLAMGLLQSCVNPSIYKHTVSNIIMIIEYIDYHKIQSCRKNTSA